MNALAGVSEAWYRLGRGAHVFIARKDGEYLCEGPQERLDLGAPGQAVLDDDTESCIRLFFTKQECDEYCGIWRELLGVGVGPENQQIRTVEAILPDIWKHLAVIVANSYCDYQVSPRIDVCTLQPGNYPTPLDTLFTEQAELN